MLILSRMDQDEFEDFRKFSVENYAKAIFRNLRVTYRQALIRANEESEEVLPKGFFTDNHFFFNLEMQEDFEKVGYLWYYINQRVNSAFIYDFYILPAYRRRGLGRVALQKMEAKLESQQIKVVRLNVFSDNKIAKELYTDQGFTPCNEILQKFI